MPSLREREVELAPLEMVRDRALASHRRGSDFDP